MCSFGDDDNDDDIEINKEILNPQVDISDAHTQFMDCQSSPVPLYGNFTFIYQD